MSYDNSKVRIIEAETFDQRYERMLSNFDRSPKFIERGRYSNRDPRNNVVIVTTRPEGSHLIREWDFSHNLVTNDGDIFYAKMGAGETPAANEGASRMELANPASQTAPTKTDVYSDMIDPVTDSRKTFDGGYPKTNDDDTDNPGRGTKVVSYKTSWSGADFAADGLKNGAIHDNASPSGATKLVAFFGYDTKNKSSSDTLKIYVNHAFLDAGA